MTLHHSKVCMICYNLKYFHMNFHSVKYYQNLNFNYVFEKITPTISNTNFLKFIILHLCIVSVYFYDDKK